MGSWLATVLRTLLMLRGPTSSTRTALHRIDAHSSNPFRGGVHPFALMEVIPIILGAANFTTFRGVNRSACASTFGRTSDAEYQIKERYKLLKNTPTTDYRSILPAMTTADNLANLFQNLKVSG